MVRAFFCVAARSIPARAGEPRIEAPRLQSGKVYPRTCGGTLFCSSVRPSFKGLSPHVRGNHGRLVFRLSPDGSIPARAGEPQCRPVADTLPEVYPRTCGGTRQGCLTGKSGGGLSPHVRGNPRRTPVDLRGVGSIPARAGEPPPPRVSRLVVWVYPRTCGGTDARQSTCAQSSGLSPHVRGNRRCSTPPFNAAGSIPARAGEPGCTRSTRGA